MGRNIAWRALASDDAPSESAPPVEADVPHERTRRSLEDRLSARRGRVAETSQLRARVDRRLDSGPGFVKREDGSYAFQGTGGDDNYSVRATKSGGVVVRDNVSGREYELSAKKAKKGVTIRGLGGNDIIDASASTVRIELTGGSGNDVLVGGRRADAIKGGRGDDLIDGGRGNDQLIGSVGDDYLAGHGGSDFIRGGDGSDRIEAGSGADQLYGDRRDRLDAGEDRDVDVVVGERGTPEAEGMTRRDRSFDYDPRRVDRFLENNPGFDIKGSRDFVERTRAELGVMLETEQGRGLLRELSRALKKQKETLKIREKDGPSGTIDFRKDRIEIGHWSDGGSQTPLPILFHELAHAYQDLISGFPAGSTRFRGGERAPNFERQVTGLSYRGEDGRIHSGEELRYTDNKFRRELGLAERTTYSGERGRPGRWLEGYE